MKKTFLTLTLFAISLASAQSYPKQPDPTIVEIVPGPKVEKKETAEKSDVVVTEDTKEAEKQPAKETANTEATTNAPAVKDERVAATEPKQ